MISLDVRVFVF